MYVYFVRTADKPMRVKVGKSNDPHSRIQTLQTGCPSGLVMVGTIKCKSERHSHEVEKAIHEVLAPFRLGGEWFKYSGLVKKTIHRLTHNGEKALTRFFIGDKWHDGWQEHLKSMEYEVAREKKENQEATKKIRAGLTNKSGGSCTNAAVK